MYRVSQYTPFPAGCPYRFSRASLSVDTGVSTLYFAADSSSGLELYSTATNYKLPVVLGTSEQDLPSGCTIASLKLLTPNQSWVTIEHTGFSLSMQGGRTYVEVTC